MPNPQVSVVLPIRNAEHRIVAEIERILEAVSDLSRKAVEIIVVDDASNDSTPELLSEIKARLPQVRSQRLDQPRGLEMAGQAGLQSARGEIVFIQEDSGPLRVEDLRRLYQLANDDSILAARAHSTPRPPSGPLLSRLHAAGAKAINPLDKLPADLPPSTLQMIRRAKWNELNAQTQRPLALESEWFDLTSVVH
jgi:glycosyltransferase involved in cell wall biosynthesis